MGGPHETSRPDQMPDLRDELRVALSARRELSPDLEDTLVSSLLQQIERAVDARVDARIAEFMRKQPRKPRGRTGALIATLALAIPLSVAAGGPSGLWGVIAISGVIVLINLIDWIR